MSEQNGELSLRELVLKTKKWLGYLKARWILIGTVMAAGGAVGLTYALVKKPTYAGQLTFVLSNDSKTGGLSSIAGQFGIDLGAMSGADGAFEGENIMELLKSKRIICGAMFKPITPGGPLLINLIGEKAGFFNKWAKYESLTGAFPFAMNRVAPVQDSLMDVLHDFIMKHYLEIAKPDKKLSFYSVTTTSTDERISVYLTRFMVEEAAKMYIQQKTKAARNNLDMLQHEADSLRDRLGGTIYSTASQMDNTFNLNPALQTRRASIQQNQVQVQALGAAYGEVVKNLEIAKITLMKEIPLYQIIDEPTFPLVRERVGKVLATCLGAFVFGFICVMVILFNGLFRAVMKG